MANEVIEFQLAVQRVGLASPEPLAPLSPREREVLALLAEGRTDGEIAERLYISKKTASVHVANIKGKLGASSRVEVALIAAQHGLIDADAASRTVREPAGTGRGGVVCPFKGLASFDVVDAGFFFGRERLVAELVAKVAGSPFLAVVGPSGSGKSSVVRAGLVPALRSGVLPGSEHWLVAIVRPGDAPAAAIRHGAALALRRRGVVVTDEANLDEMLDELPGDARLVFVIDQFEETFTVCQDDAERSAFVRDLVGLARDPAFRALVVPVLRADFYGRCAGYPGLPDLLAANQVLVGPMQADELARAIDLPARAAGLRVEAELTAALVNDVLNEPGGLPLLSTTLLDLWQKRTGRTMRLESYERIGGVSGAVARLAEAAFERLTQPQQEIARSILLRLATSGEGTVAVRMPVLQRDFDLQDADVAAVLGVLVESRLLTVADGSVEVAHEALLHEWPRLRGWLEEDAEGQQVRLHLTHAARAWAESSEDRAELYRGARLAAAIEWSAGHQYELNEGERRFLAASRAASEEENERQRRANRRLRVLLAGAASFLVVAVVTATFAMMQQARAEQEGARAAAEQGRAERAAAIARSRELAASAIAVLDEDPSLSKLLALAAASIETPPLESIAVLHAALSADRTVFRYRWPDDDQLGGELWTDLDPSGTRIVASGVAEAPSSHLDLVDTASSTALWRFTPASPGIVIGPSFFSADGAQVIAGTAWVDGNAEPPETGLGVQILDAATGQPVRLLSIGPCGGTVHAISATHLLVRFHAAPEGEPVVCAPMARGSEVGVGLVDLDTGELAVFASDAAPVGGALSRDGRRVAFDEIVDQKQMTVVADVATGERIWQVESLVHDTWVTGLNDDGSLLLASDQPILVFDVNGGTDPIARFDEHAGESFAAEFAPGTDTVYSTGRDATLRHWDARSATEIAVFDAVGSGRPAVADDGGRVLVADIESPSVAMIRTGLAGDIAAIETCPSFVAASSLVVAAGRASFMEVCSDDETYLGVVRIVDLATRSVRHSVAGFDGQVLSASPDGARLVFQSSFLPEGATFPYAGPLVVLDAETGHPLHELEGTCSWDWDKVASDVPRTEAGDCAAFPGRPFPMWALSMRWSPDGSMIFAADNHNADGYYAVWDATTGALLRTGSANGGVKAFDAIFSPDSRELIVARYETGLLERYSTDTWDLLQSVQLESSVEGRDRVWFAGYTPDGSSLVAVGGFLGAGGGSLLWLDPDTLLPLRPVVRDAHDGSPKAVAMSPDGVLLATGASGDPVRIWDVATGALVHEIPMGDTQVQGVAFVDATHVAVTPQTGGLLVMTIDSRELLELARASLTRGFTARECDRYDFGDKCPSLAELREN